MARDTVSTGRKGPARAQPIGRIGRGLVFGLAALSAVGPAAAADLRGLDPVPDVRGRFLATCEDLGGFCFADACGSDQIEAAQGCRAACPSSVILRVAPAACTGVDRLPTIVLRRRG